MQESLCWNAARTGENLRSAGQVASNITAMVRTSPVAKHASHYRATATHTFNTLTNNTCMLQQAVRELMPELYQPGHQYAKAGVLLLGLLPEDAVPYTLFTPTKDISSDTLQSSLDAVNKRYGEGTLRYEANGLLRPWMAHRNCMSPAYTTDWQSFMTVS